MDGTADELKPYQSVAVATILPAIQTFGETVVGMGESGQWVGIEAGLVKT